MKRYHWLFPNRNNCAIWIFSLVMLTGVLFFNWKAETVLLTYLFETIVVGVIHIFKLWACYRYSRVAKSDSGKHELKDFFSIPFFTVHYFFFVCIQSVFVFVFFESLIPGVKDPFKVVENYSILLANPEMHLACFSIILFNLVLSLQNFFFPAKFKERTIEQLFLQPYLRIMIQQMVTIFTGFAIMLFNAAIASAVLLIMLRLLIDLALQRASVNPEFRAMLVDRLSKNGSPKERQQAAKQLHSFLDN